MALKKYNKSQRRKSMGPKKYKPKTPGKLAVLKKKLKRAGGYDVHHSQLFGKGCHSDDFKQFFEALAKPPKHRSRADMGLLKLLFADVQALQSIPASNFEGICRNIIHRHIPRKGLVVEKGEMAKEAYIVATGSIDVEVGNGIVVFQFKPGDIFGDYGLQKDDAKRTADCRARTNVDVIAVPRKTYIKFMMLHMYGNKDLKKEFFTKKLCFSIYPTVPDFECKAFTEQMNWMVCKSFKKGDVIGLQGHPSKKIYFVAAGIIRVLKTVSIEGTPTVCEVGHYRKGQAFGATYTSINETNVHTWCADIDSTLYVINRADFQRLFGQESVAMYKATTNIVNCEDRELRQGLKHQRYWKSYKKELLDTVKCGANTQWLVAPKRAELYGETAIVIHSAQRSHIDVEEFINE